ncbi:sigma-70 family RNA polymerase sigma factor [Pseudoxanthomonas sp.]|uniref:RNA polymerase sigma factor n=1 Tax=Pseudoxanthomonas sp. TaxID=1871049 RepID=UPI0025D61998|nr:sigma-70 family RNA polymerase sigma factor [Pseudoxanthomonas sp.]
MPAAPGGSEATLTHEDYRALRAQALRLCRRAHEADDLVQEALLAGLLAGRHDLPWLSGVVRHQAAMAARAAGRRRRREAEAGLLAGSEESPSPHALTSNSNACPPWLAALPPSARRLAILALHGLSADEIRWILRIEPTAFRQRLTRIRKALAAQSPAARAESIALAHQRDPARSVDLAFGLARRALKAAMQAGEGLGTHDPDGHLILIDAGAHTSPSRGNVRKGITQEDIPCSDTAR